MGSSTDGICWRIALIGLILATVGSTGCTNNDIVVHVEGLGADTASLRVESTLDQQPLKSISVLNSLEEFILNLPEDREGQLGLKVTALSAEGCKIGSGEGMVEFHQGASQPTEVTVSISRFPAKRCTLSVEVVGNGRVTSFIGTQADGKIVCDQSGGSCQSDYVVPTASVFLQAVPGTGVYVSEFFSSVSTCSGSNGCQLSVTGNLTVRVYFVPRFCMQRGWCTYPPVAANALLAIWGNATNLWAVGEKSTILHFDGLRWSADTNSGQFGSPPSVLTSLWGSSANDVWAVGSGGVILHYDGKSWQEDPRSRALTTTELDAVWGSAQGKAWILGTGGVLLRLDTTQWTLQPPISSPGGQALLSLWGSQTAGFWAVGNGGTVFRNDGTDWRPQPTNVNNLPVTNLYSIWGSADADIWVAGGSGLLGHWNGTAWTAYPNLTPQTFNDVWSSGVQSGWAVGTSGTIFHLGSGIPTASTSSTPNGLNSVWGDGEIVWAVGDQGTLVTYQP